LSRRLSWNKLGALGHPAAGLRGHMAFVAGSSPAITAAACFCRRRWPHQRHLGAGRDLQAHRFQGPARTAWCRALTCSSTAATPGGGSARRFGHRGLHHRGASLRGQPGAPGLHGASAQCCKRLHRRQCHQQGQRGNRGADHALLGQPAHGQQHAHQGQWQTTP
jgi:hypothetical protein